MVSSKCPCFATNLQSRSKITRLSVEFSVNFSEILKYFNLEAKDSKIIVTPEGVDTLHFVFVPQNRKSMKFRIFYPSSFLKH